MTEKKIIKTRDLKIGMYVNLGKSWLHHSFLRPTFIITSEKQIKKIIANGIHKVTVDLGKSKIEELSALSRDDRHIDKLKKDASQGSQGVHRQPEDKKDNLHPEDEKDNLHTEGKQNNIGADEVGEIVEFDPMERIADEFHEIISNANIPPIEKAEAVYTHSIRMMDTMLAQPDAANIGQGKKIIYETVDHILADDETANHLSQITSHDYYTYTHSVNVGVYSILLAKALFKGTSLHNMQELGAGFFLHDLGKCDVPSSLINKPARLNDEEWEIMRNHPSRGRRLLTEAEQLSKECGVIVMQHHEREDGTGYPFGLERDEIHVYGRICCIADVYDALTSTRAYKNKLSPFEAFRVMKKEMINYFNKDLFACFIEQFAKAQ